MTQLTAEEKAHLKSVFDSIATERILTYLNAESRNPYAALRRYDWNSKLSAALFETIGHFEVSFRNTLDQALAGRHSFNKRTGDWLDNAHGELTDRSAEAITEAREHAADNRRRGRGSHASGRGHIVAELNFSFWRRLIDARYERLHGSAVMRNYPDLRQFGRNASDMKPLRDMVEPIYALRNRIAHHEPIWQHSCKQRRDDMVSLLHMTSPDLASWVREQCRLDAVISMSHPTRPLTLNDAGPLLTLQRAAYASEAQIYSDPNLPALTQTLDELRDELAGPGRGIEIGGRLIGAVRWTVDGDTAHIGRLVVAPDLQGKGIGTALLRGAEQASGAKQFELFTGHLSEANIRLYEREGYTRTRQDTLRPGVELVYMQKSAS